MAENVSFDDLRPVLAEYLELEDTECLSLPPAAYLSKELHQREVAAIFRREWLCVGRAEYVPEPGDFFTYQLLDEPLLIVRGEDGKVRALANICRHRLMPVAEGAGHAKRFVCPYHAWTYATDGQLVGAPYMKGAKNFEMQSCKLPSYRLEEWYGFLFVNLDDDAAPLGPRMHTLEEHIANYRVDSQVSILRYQQQWAGNWKLSAENSMEYYHHVGLHINTVGGQMPARMTYLPPAPADFSFTHECCGVSEEFKEGDHPFNPKGNLDSFTEAELNCGYMVYIFPAFTMAMRPNTNNWLSFVPAGTENTRVLGGYLVSPEVRDEFPDLAEQRRDLILKVNEEDSLATTELAKVVRSSKAARGHLSPFEGTVAQFYRYLARTLVSS